MSDLEQLAVLLKAHRECGPLASLNLGSEDVAVVAGAYKGDTIAFLRQMYDCVVYGFEPQNWAHNEASTRFQNDRCVVLYDFGLGVKHETLPMGEWGTDACSFVPDLAARTQGPGELRPVEAYLTGQMALAVFNMEGYEYELLEHMGKCGLVEHIKHLVIQFHDTVEAAEQYAKTVILLEKTHTFKWHYPQEPAWSWHWWERQS